MDAVRVDLDQLTDYATALDRRADEAQAILDGLRGHQLDDEAFGEVGQSLGTPQAYQRAADALFAQLGRAEQVLAAAATALRQAADHYEGTDVDGAKTLEKKSEDTDAAR